MVLRKLMFRVQGKSHINYKDKLNTVEARKIEQNLTILL